MHRCKELKGYMEKGRVKLELGADCKVEEWYRVCREYTLKRYRETCYCYSFLKYITHA